MKLQELRQLNCLPAVEDLPAGWVCGRNKSFSCCQSKDIRSSEYNIHRECRLAQMTGEDAGGPLGGFSKGCGLGDLDKTYCATCSIHTPN
ncbi:hypothetical protein IAQ61_007898 [Plenodomus lingam]|nr:hypothetical protein IAQ61_007898 [Plenodomus lingam]